MFSYIHIFHQEHLDYIYTYFFMRIMLSKQKQNIFFSERFFQTILPAVKISISAKIKQESAREILQINKIKYARACEKRNQKKIYIKMINGRNLQEKS